MTSYNIEVTEAELGVVRLALGRMVTPKPVRAKRATAKAGELFTPNTGDSRLDAFMTASRAKHGAPKARPSHKAAKFPFGLKTMSERHRAETRQFNTVAVDSWRRLGHKVTVTNVSDATLDAGKIAVDGRNVTVEPLS